MKLTWLILISMTLPGCSLFNRDDSDEPVELESFESALSVDRQWSTSIGSNDDAFGLKLTPAVDQDQIIVVTNTGDVVAVSRNNGSVLWRQETGYRISSGAGISEQSLVFGTTDGQVIALRLDDGSPLWKATVSSEVLAAPVIHRGVTIVRVQDGRVYGFEEANGNRTWVLDQTIPLLTLRGNSQPVAKGGFAYMGFDNGKVAAVRVSDGTMIWEKAISSTSGRNEIERIKDIDGRLALLASDVYAAGYNGNLTSLTSDSGRVLWSRELSSATGLTAVRSIVYISGADDAVWALERVSGGTLWKQEGLMNRGISAPVAQGDYAVISDRFGYLHWLNAGDGDFAARIKVSGEPMMGELISDQDQLIVYAKDGKLTAYRLGE